MKKMACFVLALSLVFSFCGCGKKNAGQDKLTLRPGLYTVGKDLAPGVYAANPEDASKTAYVKLRSMAPGTEKAEMVVLGTGGSSADVILEDGRTMEVIFADVTFRLLNTDVAGAKAAAEAAASPSPEPTPEPTPTPTPTPTPEPTPNVIPERGEEPLSDDTVRPEIQEFLDGYEAFMNEYIDFMQAYMNGGAADRTEEYNELVAKYADYTKKVKSLEDHREDLTPAELSLYQQVSARVAEKTQSLGGEDL